MEPEAQHLDREAEAQLIERAKRGDCAALGENAATVTDAEIAVLVNRSRNRDDDAFEKLILLLGKELANFLARRVDCAQDAEGLYWEIWSHVWQSLPRFRGPAAQFRAWLFAIANHLTHHLYRTRKRKPQPAVLGFAACSVAARDDVVRSCVAREESHWCQRCIRGHLPPRQSRALELLEFDGCTEREAADEMGISRGSCEQLLHRARLTMRRLSRGRCRVVVKARAAAQCPLRQGMV